jgi:muramoyltetrapeptide carboxypeptidase
MIQFLKAKDTIGLVAPAGIVKPPQIENGIKLLNDSGFKVELGQHLFGKFRYFSGSIDQRLSDIHAFLEKPNISAIYAVRGGSGSSQLLPYLDFDKWHQTKKCLIGFSDITALHWPLWQMSKIISFSGMTFTLQLKRSNPYLKNFFLQLQGKKRNISEDDIGNTKLIFKNKSEVKGILLGGTLSIINSLLGTPYLKPIEQDFILYLEDVNEKLYSIERMIVQLKLAGMFTNLKAIIFGGFQKTNKLINVWPAVKNHLPPDIPKILNFPYGHYIQSYSLPFGVEARLKFDPFSLEW